MTNTRTIERNFGLRPATSSTMRLRLTFTESAVNAAAGTSTVKCVISVHNNSTTTSHHYLEGNGVIHAKIGAGTNARVKTIKGSVTDFSLKPGGTKVIATVEWDSVNHRTGSIAVSCSYFSWPTGTGGAAGPSSIAAGTLTLNNAPAPPKPPTWAVPAVLGGPGTSTVLHWVNHDTASNPIAPYTMMSILVEQSDYPDHFTPVSYLADCSNVAGGSLAKSNYCIQTFWYTALGAGTQPSLASSPIFYNNVPASHLVKVKPPRNPPAQATGWGIAVSRAVGVPATQANARIQTFMPVSGVAPASVYGKLNQIWQEPMLGPSKGGNPAPAADPNADFPWTTQQQINVSGPPWPTSYTVPTLGGYWYRFTLTVRNTLTQGAVSVGQIYYSPGLPPDTGGNTGGSGDDTDPYAPQAPGAVYGQSLNYAAASCAVTSVAAPILDPSVSARALSAGNDIALTNYCGDPRAYWLSASVGGNNTASPYVANVNTSTYSAKNAQIIPAQMLYALQAVGIAHVDRGHQITYNRANNNTGGTISNYVYIGGNPDGANTAASFAVPSGANSVQVSAMAWINSANTTPGRTVQPFSALKFTALFANGAVAGTNTQTPANIAVNQLVQLQGTWALPASTARVVAAWEANTAAGANWAGGYGTGEQITMTAFMMLFNGKANQPYFDGGYPDQPSLQIIDGGDLGLTVLSGIEDIIDANVSGPDPHSPDIGSWPPGVVNPPSFFALGYPYAGWAGQWTGDAGNSSGYGGPSQISAPTYAEYGLPSGDTAQVWTDASDAQGNVQVMGYDATAAVVIAGDPTLASTAGSLVALTPGNSFAVNTVAYCPGWSSALGNLARYRLVTTGTGAGTTYSPPITESGPLIWGFSIPAGATGAYLALEAMTGDPQDVVSFSKPTFRKVVDLSALGYLGTANAVPLRMAQIQMPAYYRKNGWPTKAPYLLTDASALSFIPSTPPGTVGAPVLVDPRSVDLGSDLRFLASQGYSQASRIWTPWKSTGVHAVTMHGADDDSTPYYAPANDNNAFNYALGANVVNGRLVGGQRVSIPSIQFDSAIGTYLYSDDLDAAGLTAYTVILALNLANPYVAGGGVWSSAPKASGGGPDPEADLAGVNYRAVRSAGASLTVSSEGMVDRAVQVGMATTLHKPTYLALSFSDSQNGICYADFPGSVLNTSMGLSAVSGPLTGSVVLGADATNGLAAGTFSLFEMNIYFGAMTLAAIQREISLLGQVYG